MGEESVDDTSNQIADIAAGDAPDMPPAGFDDDLDFYTVSGAPNEEPAAAISAFVEDEPPEVSTMGASAAGLAQAWQQVWAPLSLVSLTSHQLSLT